MSVHFSDAVVFEYISELVIHDFKPKSGWLSGGVVVSISFESFLVQLNQSAPWYCKYNHSLSVATLVFHAEQHGLFSCRSPPFKVPGYVSLTITQNQVDYFSNGERFLYLSPSLDLNNRFHRATALTHSLLNLRQTPSLDTSDQSSTRIQSTHGMWFTLIPHHGPARGGTLVQIQGWGLSQEFRWTFNGKAKCIFRSSVVPAIVRRDSGTLSCRSPPRLRNMTSVSLGISLSGSLDDFKNVGLFTYDEDVVVVKLQPNNGPVSGGTTVKLYGGPFVQYDESDLACRFGDTIVGARWLDEALIECISPEFKIVDSVQTMSIFNMLWVPEVQSIYVENENFVSEIQSIEIVGAPDVKNEIQLLRLEINEQHCVPGDFFRLKLLEQWWGPIELYASATLLEKELQHILGIGSVNVTELDLLLSSITHSRMYEIHFNSPNRWWRSEVRGNQRKRDHAHY